MWNSRKMNSNCIFITILVLVTYFSISHCYVYTRRVSSKSGLCKGGDGNLHAVGETWFYEKYCEQATCTIHNGKLYEDVMGCGSIQDPPSGCWKEYRQQELYPTCCPTIVCG